MKKVIALMFSLVIIAVLAGCGTTNVDMNYKGLDTTNGKAIAHVNTTVTACHLFGTWPIMYDASYTNTFNEFTKEAKRLNGNKVNVVESITEKKWSIVPVITWIFTPVTTTVAGDVFP
ncbi:MAG: hypothetical protein WCR55_05015 [Lentisphaerota bacterium]